MSNVLKRHSNSPIGTFFWQFCKVIISVLVVVLYSRNLGSAGRGQLSILLLNLQLVLMLSELVAGGALANLLAKFPARRILPTAWAFLLMVLGVGFVVGLLLGYPSQILWLLLLQGLFLGLLNIQYNLYQAKGWIQRRNQLQLALEVLKLLGLCAILLINIGFDSSSANLSFNVTSVLTILIVASGIIASISLWKTRHQISVKYDSHVKYDSNVETDSKSVGLFSWIRPPKEMFSMGLGSQIGHLLLFLLYRLPLWLVGYSFGDEAAGVLANALLMADTVWILGNSFGTVLHSRVLNSQQKRFHETLLSRYVVMSGFGTALAIWIALLLPVSVYTSVFGPSFGGLKFDFLLITPAVFLLAISAPIGHYLHALNRFGTLIKVYGFSVVVLLLGWWISGWNEFNHKMVAVDVAFLTLFLLNYLSVGFRLRLGHESLLILRWLRRRFRMASYKK